MNIYSYKHNGQLDKTGSVSCVNIQSPKAIEWTSRITVMCLQHKEQVLLRVT